MNTFGINVNYTTGSGKTNDRFYEVQAKDVEAAKRKVRRIFNDNWNFRHCRINNLTHSGGTIEVCKTDTKPEFYIGREVETNTGEVFTILSTFDALHGGKGLVIQRKGQQPKLTNEAELRRNMEPKITCEYWSIYPTGSAYKNTAPITSSSYDLDQITQVKITKRNGKIVNKEII